MASKSSALLLDTKGFDKMVEALSPENRKPILKKVMLSGAGIVRQKVRDKYKSIKPNSDLDRAITMHLYPSYEGAVVRRFYVKGGTARSYKKDNPFLRAYILNFIEKGAVDRKTKGRGQRYPRQQLNRGSMPAYKFFQKGRTAGKRAALKEMERMMLQEITKQSRK